MSDRVAIEAYVDDAVEDLPEAFRENFDTVVFLVEDVPDDDVARRFAGRRVLGLYSGVPIPRRSIWNTARLPSRIYVYAQPLLQYCAERDVDVKEMVNHVVVHEVAHHFGFNDDEIYSIQDDHRAPETRVPPRTNLGWRLTVLRADLTVMAWFGVFALMFVAWISMLPVHHWRPCEVAPRDSYAYVCPR